MEARVFYIVIVIFGSTVAEVALHHEKDDFTLEDLATKHLPNRSVCGLLWSSDRNRLNVLTDLGEFPWTVAIEYQRKVAPLDNVGIRCGGSLINNRYVLTASYCLTQTDFEPVAVKLGEWNVATDPDCPPEEEGNESCADPVKKVAIENIIPHPNYVNTTGNNDIGLLRLAEDIVYTMYIQPICLPSLSLISSNFENGLIIAGWGLNKDGATRINFKLLWKMSQINNQECKEKLGDGIVVTNNQLCAVGEKQQEGCRSDAGSALVQLYGDTNDQQWHQVGVNSWSPQCTNGETPVVYTNVVKYVPWIINEIS